MKNKKSGKGKFVLGALVGAGAALLFAPQKGSETRKQLKGKFDELLAKIKEIDIKEVREDLEKRITQIKEDLKDLDKEKALSIAKTKAEQLKVKTEELVEIVKEKGTPVLQKITAELKDKTATALKEIVSKLESEESKETKKSAK